MAIKEVEIHGHKVKYDDESHTAKKGVEYLKHKLDKDEADVHFHAAKTSDKQYSRFEVHDNEGDGQHDLTLVREDGGYTLRKRSHH